MTPSITNPTISRRIKRLQKIQLGTLLQFFGLIIGFIGAFYLTFLSSPIGSEPDGSVFIQTGGNVYQNFKIGTRFFFFGFLCELIGLVLNEFRPRLTLKRFA